MQEDVITGFENRRMVLLHNTAGKEIDGKAVSNLQDDIYSNRAIANLMLGRFIREANERIQRTAEWFDHPHPNNRRHDGECDFAAIKLCRAYHLFKKSERLELETIERIQHFFLDRNFKSIHPSENHNFLFHTSRYLMAQVFQNVKFKIYGKTGYELLDEDSQWLKAFIRYRARRGWGEFDSSFYFIPDWECLTNLYDYCQEKILKRLAEMMLTLLLVDMAVDSLNGMYCGAHGRIYEIDALDHKNEGTYPLQYLYFGEPSIENLGQRDTVVDALASLYRPPKIVLDIALNRIESYENLERKHLHNTEDVMPKQPIEGSICKYTYYTPQYVMGCVQRQDSYPKDCPGKWYAHHQQHQWDITVGIRTNARIFTHHPGKSDKEHGYWTGDIQCGCGHFLQCKSALLALYEIPMNEPYQFIHAYVPKKTFDEVIEKDGFIFLRAGDVCVALNLLKGHEWTSVGQWKDVEVISYGAKNGIVCEVGLITEFQSFKEFSQEITSNSIQFDERAMCLKYQSKHIGELQINSRGLRKLNDKVIDLEYPTYHCPYIYSKWDSAIIDIRKGDQCLQLNFYKE